ncbi:hypothetical protein Efla_000304 [Eimeria flavescens]
MARKLFIVTGANKGIGFEVVKKLCQQFKSEDAVIILTSRCPERGKQAIEKLAAEGLTASMEQLDVTDEKSIQNFCETVKKSYGEIDSLVNNAGFAFAHGAKEPLATQATVTCGINYFGTRNLCKAIFPQLKKGARVVNRNESDEQAEADAQDSDTPGRAFAALTSDPLCVLLLADLNIKIQAEREKYSIFNSLAVNEQCHQSTNSVTSISIHPLISSRRKKCITSIREEAALIAMTAAWARMYNRNPAEEVIITSCCPGHCKTDMGGWDRAPLSAADGAALITPLALGATKEQHGKFVCGEGTLDLSEEVDGQGDGCGYVRMPEIHEMKS